jgi:hypothetical protein
MATKKNANVHVSRKGKKHASAGKGKKRRRTALAKKGRAGSWQNCNLWPPAGWKGLFFICY